VGDFNGDGRIDVAFARSSDKLVIHTGREDRFLSGAPWRKFDLPAFGVARPVFLDGNACRDILLFHPAGPHARRVELLVF
jgi:hypothetical protein